MKKLISFFSFTLLLLNGVLFAQSNPDNSDNFYDVEMIQEIRIGFEVDDWQYILDSLRVNGEELLLGNVEINGEEYSDSGIRYRDTRSFVVGGDRNGLHLKLNFIKKNQNHQGIRTIKLSNSLRDPSMVREVLSYEIAGSYMPAPKANYAKVYINDEYYGVFVNIEAVGEEFLDEHFGSHDGSFFKCSPNLEERAPKGCKSNVYGSLQYDNGAKCYLNNFEIRSENGWDDLIEFTRILNEQPERIESVLNVDRTLWMMAFNSVLVNLSSYSGQFSHNYYLYKDEHGRFNPVIWDMNLSFGSYKNPDFGPSLSLKNLQELDPMLHANNEAKPLISKLLENEENKKLYLSHVRTILYDYFLSGLYEKKAKELQRLIRIPLINDRNKFYSSSEFENSMTTTIGKRSKIPGLKELMDERKSFLRKHETLSVIPPQVTDINIKHREELSAKKIEDFDLKIKIEKYARNVRLYYRFDENEEFRIAKIYDDGQNDDETANDEIFSIVISPDYGKDAMQFYIVAENAKTISFDPPRYMYNFHNISLEELNQ